MGQADFYPIGQIHLQLDPHFPKAAPRIVGNLNDRCPLQPRNALLSIMRSIMRRVSIRTFLDQAKTSLPSALRDGHSHLTFVIGNQSAGKFS
jgi:hypothetical protein